MHRLVGSILAALVASAACKTPSFQCDENADCVDGPVLGVCQEADACSFPDGECASGQRFGEHAGNGLAGTCAPGGATAGSGGTGPLTDGGGTFPSGSGDLAMDPYGTCEANDDCVSSTAACIFSGEFRMCAQECLEVDLTGAGCPAPVGQGGNRACLLTGMMDRTRCFILCEGQNELCPNGMECAGGTVCSWR